ncbi:MAG: DUF302 domain-containing protein [Gemmatimonadales bacterium]
MHTPIVKPGQALFTLLIALTLHATPALAQQMSPPPDFIITSRSSRGFDETIEGLKTAIESENLMVVTEINPQQMLRMVGVRTGGMRQLLFFHPRYMKQLIETNRNGAIEPPLKLVVMEMPDGSVMVRYVNPNYLFGRYEGLEDLGTELSEVVQRIAASVQ